MTRYCLCSSSNVSEKLRKTHLLESFDNKIHLIIKYICLSHYFGPPESFLTDNSREFNKENFNDIAQNINIMIHATPAQSP